MQEIKIPWKSWVLVCDASKALLLRNDGDEELLNLVPVKIETEDHPPTHELGTSPPGRSFASNGSRRSAVEGTDLHDLAEEQFLTGLANELTRQIRTFNIHRLLLVAPPRALGFLRRHLDPAVQAIVSGEIAKDLAHLPTAEIERHLAP
jgi:protein required for attachment to host cells